MITPDGYRLLTHYALSGTFIIELGDQLADWSETCQKRRADRLIEDEFNCTVLSVDIHGKNHSLPLDLNTELIKEWSFNADMVTDFGTLEHTDDIYQSLKNVHQFLVKDGISIHANPDESYTNHGNFYFTPEFWGAYCNLCGFELVSCETIPVYVPENPMHEIYAVVKHSGDKKYPSREEFEKECGKLVKKWE